MATEYLNINANGDVTNNGDYLALNDAVESQTANDVVGFRTNTNNRGTGSVSAVLTNLPNPAFAFTSITFRVRGRIINWDNDTNTHTARCVYNSTNYNLTFGSTETAWTTKTITVPIAGATTALVNAATVSLLQTAYSANMGADGSSVEFDLIELEVVYTPALSEVITITTNNATVTTVIKRTVVCATEILLQRFGGFGTTETFFYDLDGSIETLGPWANLSNATDGSILTYSFDGSNAGARWVGVPVPATGAEVVNVRARAYVYTNLTSIDQIEFIWKTDINSYGGSYDMPTTGHPISEGNSTPGWTDWWQMNPVNHTDGRDVIPYPRTELASIGIGVQGEIASTENRLYTAEYEITTGARIQGYFNGTADDVSSVWSNEANVLDGSTSTAATTTTASSSLILSGHTATGIPDGAEIYGVVVRVFYEKTNGTLFIRFLDSADNELNGALGPRPIIPMPSARWSGWIGVEAPVGGWTAAEVAALKVDCYINTAATSVYKVDIAVLYEDFNPQGSIVTRTTASNRSVTCTTEVLALTSNNATVYKNFPRSVTTVTRQLKRWKGLNYQTLKFGGVNESSGTNIANALDSSLVTSCVGDIAIVKWGRGVSSSVGGVDSLTEIPLKVEVRAYTSNQSMRLYAGYDTFATRTDFGLEQLGIIGSINNPGSWSDWLQVNTANYNWEDPHNHDYDPLSWDQIKDDLVVGFDYGGGQPGYCHALEVRITSGEAEFRTGYFDGHESVVDSSAEWSNDANAYDGTLTTFATAPGDSTGRLAIQGNTLTQGTASDEILGVYHRMYAKLQWTSTNEAGCYSVLSNHNSGDGGSNQPAIHNNIAFKNFTGIWNTPHYPATGAYDFFEIASSNTGFWTPWYSTKLDDSAIDYILRDPQKWTHLSNFWGVARVTAGAAASTIHVSRFEIAVLAAPTNANRKGGRANLARTVACTTEVLTLADNNATVVASTNLDVTGITEVISVVENAAAVITTAPRTVTCATEVISVVENAAAVITTAPRTVTCTTEVISVVENAATVGSTRDVAGATEVISVVENAATVEFGSANLNVNCTTEIVTVVEFVASISFNRTVVGSPETVSVVENAASVAENRGVISATEVVILGENVATVITNVPRVVAGTTEVILVTEPVAISNTTRGVPGTTEVVTVAEPAATVDATRGITTAPETITVDATAATIQKLRPVVGATEAITTSSPAATIQKVRQVVGATEGITTTEPAAAISTTRIVTGLTEVISVAANIAIITAGQNRGVNCSTEEISVVENAATVITNIPRAVVGATEEVSIFENAATVVTNVPRVVTCATEVVTFTENVANVTTSSNRIVTGLVESATIIENAATIARTREVISAVEAVLLSASTASVFKERVVACVAEAVSVAAVAAAVVRSRSVQATAEAVVLTAAAATILTNTPRSVSAITEIVSLIASPGTITYGRIVSGSSENITIGDNTATIATARSVAGAAEVVTLYVNAAGVTFKQYGTMPGELIYVHPQGQAFIMVDGRMSQL